jgi:pilus assembly protein FimV
VEPPKAEAAAPEAPKAEEPKQEPPKQEVAKTEPAKPAPAPSPAPAPADASLSDMMSSPYVLGGIGAALLALLVGLNLYRKRKVEKSDEFKSTGEGVHANSLFGATGGQSVDTGATSTFNSSFIPAASQLDSNEVDPVAEADVYIAYGREEQAEDILKEALRLQPDRHAVRVKLLEIYSRRADKPSFMAVAQELRERTGGVGEDWERGAKLGRALDPSEPMFAGSGSVDPLRGPTTELRLDPAVSGGRPATLGGMAAPAMVDLPVDTPAPDSVFSASLGAPSRGPDTAMTPDTAMPLDSRLSGETRQGVSTSTGPATHFEATLAPATQPLEPAKADILNVATNSAIDFSALDFDLTSPATRQPDGPRRRCRRRRASTCRSIPSRWRMTRCRCRRCRHRPGRCRRQPLAGSARSRTLTCRCLLARRSRSPSSRQLLHQSQHGSRRSRASRLRRHRTCSRCWRNRCRGRPCSAMSAPCPTNARPVDVEH